MKSLTLSMKAVVETRADVTGQLVLPGDAVLIERGRPRWLIVKCPCGCGDDIPLNLDERAGKAWRLYKSAQSVLTLFPSVWRDTRCESHFIVWRNKISLFGEADGDARYSWNDPCLAEIYRRVLERWPSSGWASYVEVADELGEIPWDVLDACRHLVRTGSFIEGRDDYRVMFCRKG